MNKQNLESGHSLIEMLVSLAIMGVLSIGSIAGFNYAMNKYRANEILNEVRKRATLVSMQIASGRTDNLSTAEFQNNIGYATFEPNIIYAAKTNRLSFPVSNVKPAVCSQMKQTVTPYTQIRKINSNCSLITFNADLSLNDRMDVGSCDNGGIYLSYLADPCSQNNTTGDFECQKNSDCEEGEYCSLSGEYAQKVPSRSSCRSIDEGQYVVFLGKTYLLGNNRSFWSAENWCRAQGMALASLSDLGLTGNEVCRQGVDPNCLNPRSESETAYWNKFKSAFGANLTFYVKDVHLELYPAYISTQNNCGLPGSNRSLSYSRKPICK